MNIVHLSYTVTIYRLSLICMFVKCSCSYICMYVCVYVYVYVVVIMCIYV